MIGTYRLQLGPEMTFDDARELVPYFRSLGVSHLYLSPMLQAVEGSTHGYDVTDPSSVSEELGGEEAFRRLAGAGLGVVVDIVPNHMGTDEASNRYWRDPELREKFFDVDPATGKWRRFFDIDDLGAVRQEDDEVFRATHEKTLQLLAEGLVDGVRVDHPDGLADPVGYLRKLRDAGAEHVWVEKILHPGEALRDWPVDGTVGYEFLVEVASLYVDPAAHDTFTSLWHDLAGDDRPFAAWGKEAQLEQAASPFDRELDRLRRVWDPGPDVDLAEAIAAIPIYRTYVEPWSGKVHEDDRAALVGVPEALQRALLLERDDVPDEFVTRFQQTCPAITAKGIEDTAFYRYLRLLAHNDVGNDPGRWSVTVDDFHAGCVQRWERFPRNLLITSTHDTKRSGDVRARIGALTEVPERWEPFARRWASDAEQYLVLQTLVGAWPITEERIREYLQKALRERKLTSNWIEPDEEHERAVQDFAVGLMTSDDFRRDLDALLDEVKARGERAALGQVLLKLTVPGVPDVYGGDELEALFLVDPDNRRPVDWAARRDALAALEGGAAPSTFGERKLDLLRRGLALRARQGGADGLGVHRPLAAGPGTVAFARGSNVLAVAEVRADPDARIVVPADLRGPWRDVLGDRDIELGRSVAVEALTGDGGYALLERA